MSDTSKKTTPAKKNDKVKYVPVSEDGYKEVGTVINAKVLSVEEDPLYISGEVELEFYRGEKEKASQAQTRGRVPYDAGKTPGSWHWPND